MRVDGLRSRTLRTLKKVDVQEFHRKSSLISPSNKDSPRLRLLKLRTFNPRSSLLRPFCEIQDQAKSTIASNA